MGAAARKLVEGLDIVMTKIRPSEMLVDFTYQRDPRKRRSKINSISKKYDRRLLGVFHVCKRADGTIWVIDGAGRKMAMQMVGDDEPVDCVMHHHIRTPEQEAEWFLRLNPDEVAKVNASQKFKARLASNDPVAVRIHTAAIKGGLVVGGVGHNGISIQAASCLDHIGNLTRVGFIKKAGWENVKPSGTLYVALSGVLVAAPDINEGRLRQILRENPPAVVTANAMAEYGAGYLAHAREFAPRAAKTLVKTYNYHASALRVTPNWARADAAFEGYYDQWRPKVLTND